MIETVFHGHAFVEIFDVEKNESILIDPFISWNPKCDISLEDVMKKNIKAIVVTHWHSDHLWDTFDIAKEKNCLVIATFEIGSYLMAKGLKNVHTMHIGGEHNFWDFAVKFTPAVHGGGIWNLDTTFVWQAAWVIIRINWKNIYHAWDTWLTYDMKLLGEYDSIDVAFLPIGDNFTMWIKDAVIATKFIKPKIVVPIHWWTWPIIDQDPNEFARLVMLEWISSPKVLLPGQALVLK